MLLKSPNKSSKKGVYYQLTLFLATHFNININSLEIINTSFTYLAEESDENTKKECLTKIKLLLIKFQKLNFDIEFKALNDIKDHIILLYQSLIDALKRYNTVRSEMQKLEVN